MARTSLIQRSVLL